MPNAVPAKARTRKKNITAVTPHESVQLEAVLASMGEAIIATDATGTISRVNDVASAILGYKNEELLGKHFTKAVVALHENGKEIDVYSRSITRAILEGRTISEKTYYLNKKGQSVPVFLTVSPIMMSGRPVGAVEVFRDLTQEIESEKLKSDFISIASHQLRTPLSAIHMYTRMLQEGMAGKLKPDQEVFTNIILGSVERMNELIDTLLNITRIEAGSMVFKEQSVQLVQLVQDLITEFLPAASQKGITISADLPQETPEILTDPLMVKEVFSNLISNAIKYTPQDGEVSIKLTHSTKNLFFCVTDTGYGIPKVDQKRIFTKFFRADNISTKDVSGTGLGLYLSQTIIRKLSGELKFESKVNKGSTFTVILPL